MLYMINGFHSHSIVRSNGQPFIVSVKFSTENLSFGKLLINLIAVLFCMSAMSTHNTNIKSNLTYAKYIIVNLPNTNEFRLQSKMFNS